VIFRTVIQTITLTLPVAPQERTQREQIYHITTNYNKFKIHITVTIPNCRLHNLHGTDPKRLADHREMSKAESSMDKMK